MLLPDINRIFPVIHFSRKCTILVSMQRCTHAVRQKFGSSRNESNGPGVVGVGTNVVRKKEKGGKGRGSEERLPVRVAGPCRSLSSFDVITGARRGGYSVSPK